MAQLTIFYDGFCPLCVNEMASLARHDRQHCLEFEDIHQEDFATRFPSIDPERANTVLHALDEQGVLLLGLDVTAKAWSLVGVPWFRALRWPGVRRVADWAYLRFARHRFAISRLLTGKTRCERCADIRAPAGPGR